MRHDQNPSRGSPFPNLPPGSKVLVQVPGSDLSSLDRCVVSLSSLIFVGSVAWVPLAYAYAWRRWQRIPKEQKRRKALCAALLLSLAAVIVVAPYQSPRVGEWLKARKWFLWKSWLRFVAFEIIADSAEAIQDLRDRQAIYAVSPHGLFPFALAFAALPEQAQAAFGRFRPIVATATTFFPFVRTFLSWLEKIDASRATVDRALSDGARIGLAPGGIAEMFEGYPKPGTLPDEEYAITNQRKGFVRMAVKHGIPIVPVYCFGATKMFRRLQLPPFFERISKLLRISVVILFGAWGLPIPFRQKLQYVMGCPIYPKHAQIGADPPAEGTAPFTQEVEEMHHEFCSALADLFERYKDSYGWSMKTLRLV